MLNNNENVEIRIGNYYMDMGNGFLYDHISNIDTILKLDEKVINLRSAFLQLYM